MVCYELLQSVPGSATAFLGNTVYPVANPGSDCMTAASSNPWGSPVVGHFVGLSQSEYNDVMGAASVATALQTEYILVLCMCVAFCLGFSAGYRR